MRNVDYITGDNEMTAQETCPAIYVTFNFNSNNRDFPRRVTKSRGISREANNDPRTTTVLDHNL